MILSDNLVMIIIAKRRIRSFITRRNINKSFKPTKLENRIYVYCISICKFNQGIPTSSQSVDMQLSHAARSRECLSKIDEQIYFHPSSDAGRIRNIVCRLCKAEAARGPKQGASTSSWRREVAHFNGTSLYLRDMIGKISCEKNVELRGM